MAEFFDPNTVYFGLSNLHIAPFSDDSTPTNPQWSGDIIPIPGAVNFGPTANNSEMNFYADNIKYFSTFSNNGYTGTLEIAKIPIDFLVAIYRYIIDDNGVLIATAGGGYRNYAMMFQVEGDKSPIRLVWYNCSSGLPTVPFETMAENSDPNTQSMDLSVSPLKFSNDITATFGQCPMDTKNEETMAVYTDWFKQVYVPTVSSDAMGRMYQTSAEVLR